MKKPIKPWPRGGIVANERLTKWLEEKARASEGTPPRIPSCLQQVARKFERTPETGGGSQNNSCEERGAPAVRWVNWSDGRGTKRSEDHQLLTTQPRRRLPVPCSQLSDKTRRRRCGCETTGLAPWRAILRRAPNNLDGGSLFRQSLVSGTRSGVSYSGIFGSSPHAVDAERCPLEIP